MLVKYTLLQISHFQSPYKLILYYTNCNGESCYMLSRAYHLNQVDKTFIKLYIASYS